MKHDKALLYEVQALIDPVLPVDNQLMVDKTNPAGERLARAITAAIAESGLSSAEVARRCGVKPQAVNGWKTTGRISKEMLQSLSQVLNKPLSDFFGLDSGRRLRELRVEQPDLAEGLAVELKKETPARLAGTLQIPQYVDVRGSMGSGLILRDQPGEIQAWNVTPEWVHKNIKNHTGIKNLCIVTGFGNSMQPLFNPGDPLIVDRGIRTVEYDATYFFRVGNEGFIKILQRIPGEGIRVISKNKDYETWTIKPDMDFEVFGQVLKAWCGTDV